MIWNYNVNDITLLYTLDIIATVASLIGSCLVCYLCLRKITISKSVPLKFILALSSADFVFTVSNLMSTFESPIGSPYPTSGMNPNGLCYTEAILRHMGFLLTLSFAACLSVCSYKSITGSRSFNPYYFFKVAIISSIIFVGFLATLPLFVPEIGYIKGPEFCWITYSSLVTGYPLKFLIRCIYEGIPVTLSFLVTLISYTKVVIKIKQLPEHLVGMLNIRENRLFWYPCVLLLAFVPSLIDNFIGIYDSSRPIFVQALHLVLSHSIGFTNALVYWGQRRLYMEPEFGDKPSNDLTVHPFTHSLSSLDSERLRKQSSGDVSLGRAEHF